MTMEDFIHKAVGLRSHSVDITPYWLKSTEPEYLTSLRALGLQKWRDALSDSHSQGNVPGGRLARGACGVRLVFEAGVIFAAFRLGSARSTKRRG